MIAGRKCWRTLMACCACLPASLATAHPHVFVDGGIDFVMGAENRLDALHVTWRYDAFETLYILSSHGLSLNAEGGLDEESRQALVRLRSQFPADFDGSAHLTVDGTAVELEWPTDFDVELTGGRLEVTFSRHLETPLDVTEGDIDIAFYETTYFFAFSITDTPRIIGPSTCTAKVVPFILDNDDAVLMGTLAQLGREEAPDVGNVGAVFADRIALTCG